MHRIKLHYEKYVNVCGILHTYFNVQYNRKNQVFDNFDQHPVPVYECASANLL